MLDGVMAAADGGPQDVANLESAATAALAAISNSATPASHRKRRPRTRRRHRHEIQSPAQQRYSKAPHIMTLFDKDINLAAVSPTTALYSAARSWMYMDTSGYWLRRRRAPVAQDATAFDLPSPTLPLEPAPALALEFWPNAFDQAANRLPETRSNIDQALVTQDARIEPLKTIGSARVDGRYQLRQMKEHWVNRHRARCLDYNCRRSSIYAASVRVIQQDLRGPSVPGAPRGL
ncbi:uncharacterized protein MONBRDRAFT_39095, partial [Monosiga brevicollis MX1]